MLWGIRENPPVCRLNADRYGGHTDYNVPSKTEFEHLTDGPVRCSRRSRITCSAAVGCEWCAMTPDRQPLDQPFCASMSVCYNGIVGSQSPYDQPSSQFPGL